MALFCDHDWNTKTGMDSGSYCSKCGKSSEKEIDLSKSSGLNNGTLKESIATIRAKAEKEELISKIFGNNKP